MSLFEDLSHNFQKYVFYTHLNVSFKLPDDGKRKGQIEKSTSVEEEQPHSETSARPQSETSDRPQSETSDRPQSKTSESEQQGKDVTIVAQAFNIEGMMVISPGN